MNEISGAVLVLLACLVGIWGLVVFMTGDDTPDDF